MNKQATLGLLLVAAATGSAAAQPVTSPATCAVTIVRAPEDVRVVVEAWVRAEPRCSTALEVRIIPTDGGLYLFAQDERGHVHERVVPDAQSAGVLIASWVADDSMYVPPPTATPGRDVAPIMTSMGSESLLPPGNTPSPDPATQPRQPSKWIGVGLLLEGQSDAGGGLRADADVMTRDTYTFGVAASTSAVRMKAISGYGDGDLYTHDVKLMTTAAHTWQAGRWFLRGALGLGAVHSSVHALIMNTNGPYTFVDASGWFPTGEVVGNAGVELGKNWAFSVGPAITMYAQNYQTQSFDTYPPSPYPPSAISRRSLELMVLTGFKYRL